MKTIDEQVKQLMAEVAVLIVNQDAHGFEKQLRRTLGEVARNQREACAEAVLAMNERFSTGLRSKVHDVVLAADIGREG